MSRKYIPGSTKLSEDGIFKNVIKRINKIRKNKKSEEISYCGCCGVKTINNIRNCYSDCMWYEGPLSPDDNPH